MNCLAAVHVLREQLEITESLECPGELSLFPGPNRLDVNQSGDRGSGRALLRQGAWGVGLAGAVRAVTLVFQLILAGILSVSEFGIYAVAIAFAGVAQTFRDGGVTHWLVQGGEAQHSARAGNAFWIAVCANFAIGFILIAAANPLAAALRTPEISDLLIVIGATLPFVTTGSYFRTRLQINLRIRELSLIELLSAIARGILTVAFALAGWGPLAFVLPILPCFLLEHFLGYLYVREKPWRLRPDLGEWPSVLRQTRWAVLATLGLLVGLQGDYIVLGLFASVSTVGIYYFAYQLSLQSASLVASTISRVLTSAFVVRSNSFDQDLFSRATRMVVLWGTPVVLLLATAIRPFEQIIWGGKWSDAVPVVMVLSAGLPLYLLATVVTSGLISSGRLKEWALLNVFKAVAVVLAAMVAGLAAADSYSGLAAILSVGLGIAHLVQAAVGTHVLKLSVSRLILDSAAPSLLGPALMVISVKVAESIAESDPVRLITGPSVFLCSYLLVVAGPQVRRRFLSPRRRSRST